MLQLGSKGSDVEDLQTALGITADGDFGPATQKAVKAYQTAHGLTADGIVGPATFASLVPNEGAPDTPTPAPTAPTGGASAYNATQKVNHDALRGLGWWPFQKDPTTAEGCAEIAAWQMAKGLKGDGQAGPGTWAMLCKLAHPEWAPKPSGYAGVKQVYGDLREKDNADGHTSIDPAWEAQHMGTATTAKGKTVRFNKALCAELTLLLAAATKLSGYTPDSVQTWVVRRKRGGHDAGPRGMSMHSYAVAFDVDPAANPWGNKPSSPVVNKPLFAAVFRVAGWSCGCDWKEPDTMHFQAPHGC